MDAPQGRYRVIEKDGRLVVIDNATGRPASTSVPPPRAAGSGRPGQSSSPVAPAKGGLETLSDMLLHMAVREWDAEGRAVIHWQWTENGKAKSWDALLDPGQQRRLGLALVHLVAIPLPILLFALGGGSWIWLGFILAAYPLLRGIRGIAKLQAETRGRPSSDS